MIYDPLKPMHFIKIDKYHIYFFQKYYSKIAFLK